MIKITTEKFVKQGERLRRIVSIEGMMENAILPISISVKERPKPTGPTTTYHLQVGDLIEEDRFQKILKIVHAAGNRLHQLRQKEKELIATWKGEETFII